MMTKAKFGLSLLLACCAVWGIGAAFERAPAAAEPANVDRQTAHTDYSQGNYKDAYEKFRLLTLQPTGDPVAVAHDLRLAVESLAKLGRADEIDKYRDEVVAAHKEHWQVLHAAARSIMSGPNYGYIVAGEFHRGQRRGQGRYANSFERDRVSALRWMEQARALVVEGTDGVQAAEFFADYARYVAQGREGYEAWKLQVLTDLASLPDWDEQQGVWRGSFTPPQGAPVDADGKPIYHHQPPSFEKSQSDGERWRWLLQETARRDPTKLDFVELTFADFLHQQFGVQTLSSLGLRFPTDVVTTRNEANGAGEQDPSANPYAVHTLTDGETIARLANGPQRYELPNEFNFVKIFRRIADRGKNSSTEQACDRLAGIYQDRRQYPQAAEWWRTAIADFGPGHDRWREKALQQIVQNWGQFESVAVQPSGQGATVDFRFRNGSQVHFTAHRVKIDRLLADAQDHLQSQPQQIDSKQIELGQIGYRLVQEQQTKYIGEQVAAWDQKLKPLPNHFDSAVTVTTPLSEPGAYLLTAKMQEGNTSRIIIWIDDTAIVQKNLDGKRLYFVADAVNGQPIAGAHVEFFGYRAERIGRTRQYRVETTRFAEFTDDDGIVIPDAKLMSNRYRWLVIARTKSGRLAFSGFDGVWYGRYSAQVYRQAKAYFITDRPVYRPEQTVKYHVWVQEASYEQDKPNEFANRTFQLRIRDPQGKNVLEQNVTTDQFGGASGEWQLAEDATLGRYSLVIEPTPDLLAIFGKKKVRVQGYGNFRVEEYKKPEYEVTIETPDKPVQLGEKISAKISARYYFGAPVTNATVRYEVKRTSYEQQWYPIGRWDWLYGRGYGWLAVNYEWYPGWLRWGCIAPSPFWWPMRHEPPEVILSAEAPIGPDGTVEVSIDTEAAKRLHGDHDHRYEITAEVVDESRRTIVGQGEVLVARQPFQVVGWLERGHYRVGDEVTAHFKALTIDRKPVTGTGKLTLFQVDYDANGVPQETAVESWDVHPNEQGEVQHTLHAAAAGQFRLAYSLTDDKQRTREGAALLVVGGEGFDGRQFRFNDLELLVEKRDYQPGETVRLMINTNRVNSTVALFLRPINGVYKRPKLIRIPGKSTIVEIGVKAEDMPNFFIEALTISGGQLFTQTREIYVPPEKRIVDVQVETDRADYRPGQKSELQIRVTDAHGKPVQGSLVISAYDRSVEYISGGSNVSDIREFYWKWRNRHHPQEQCTLLRRFWQLLRRDEVGMQSIGVFGDLPPQGGAGNDVSGRRLSRQSAFEAKAMPAAAPMATRAAGAPLMADAVMESAVGAAPAESGGASESVAVRKEFADTALWKTALITDEQGKANLFFDMPENLTSWKIRSWFMGDGTRVGEGEQSVVTSKNVIVRLQAPRFFLETDEVVLSANVHNYLPQSQSVRVMLELPGETLENLDVAERTVEIPAGGETRVDWRVRVVQAGEAVVRMKAIAAEEADAVEQRFPVLVHGITKMEAVSGMLKADEQSRQITVRVPDKRNPQETELTVQFSPTIAGALVEALPYLVSYPHKTTDTTLTRFLPTVITQNILKRLGLDLSKIEQQRNNLNPQELGDPTERAKQWKRFDHNPVFSEKQVAQMVKLGLRDLAAMQLTDGGWGWFSGWGERSWPHTTAQVVRGLNLAKENGLALVPGMWERGRDWLKNYQAEQVRRLKNGPSRTKPYKLSADNLDALIFLTLVESDEVNEEMLNFLQRDRTHLGICALAMYGNSLWQLKRADELAMVSRNLEQYLVEDAENQTAYLKIPAGHAWWYWYDDDIQANAFYLKLLSRTEPQSPRAAGLAKYVLNNRKHASYWRSTRDTAVAIEALADYLQATEEHLAEMTVEVRIDGQVKRQVTITPDNLFAVDNRVRLVGEELGGGNHVIEIRKQGGGRLYFNTYLQYFTREELITKAGLEVKVERKLYRLTRDDRDIDAADASGRPTAQRKERYQRTEIALGETLRSGELVEVELTIDSKNDYSYLVFKDPKPAGFEPVELRSGYDFTSLPVYVEYRDEAANFFARTLPRGKHSVSYRMRVEIPGKFSVLPTQAAGMYAPELKANSNEFKLAITD